MAKIDLDKLINQLTDELNFQKKFKEECDSCVPQERIEMFENALEVCKDFRSLLKCSKGDKNASKHNK